MVSQQSWLGPFAVLVRVHSCDCTSWQVGWKLDSDSLPVTLSPVPHHMVFSSVFTDIAPNGTRTDS